MSLHRILFAVVALVVMGNVCQAQSVAWTATYPKFSVNQAPNAWIEVQGLAAIPAGWTITSAQAIYASAAGGPVSLIVLDHDNNGNIGHRPGPGQAIVQKRIPITAGAYNVWIECDLKPAVGLGQTYITSIIPVNPS